LDSNAIDRVRFLSDTLDVKIVGKRRISTDVTPMSPEEALRRATILQAQAELLNPYPRPRGFVFKAKTREDYERWRKAQSNPRLW
jgi:hypothetical protein